MKNTYVKTANENYKDFREFSGKATHPIALLASSLIVGFAALAIHIQSEKTLGIGIGDLFVGFIKASFIGLAIVLCIICMTAFITTVAPSPMKKALQLCCSVLCVLSFSYMIVCHVYGLYVMAPLKKEFRVIAQQQTRNKDTDTVKEKMRNLLLRRNEQLIQEKLSAKQVEWLADSDGNVTINDCYFPVKLEKLMVELKVVSASPKKEQQ